MSSTRSRLFIDCADYEDEAVYTCVAENPYSRIASHTKLALIKPLFPIGTSADINELEDELSVEGGGGGGGGGGIVVSNKQLASGSSAELTNSLESNGGDSLGKSKASNQLSAVSQCLNQRINTNNQQGKFIN